MCCPYFSVAVELEANNIDLADTNNDDEKNIVNVVQPQPVKKQEKIVQPQPVKKQDKIFVLLHTGSSKWSVKWENGTHAPIKVQGGRWSLYDTDYQILDTTPVSFMWPDGTKQTVESFDGKVIVWSTTHLSYPRIQWILGGDDEKNIVNVVQPQPVKKEEKIVQPQPVKKQVQPQPVKKQDQMFVLLHTMTSKWSVTWENGTHAPIKVQGGRWSLYDVDYQILDTTPVSFMWPDGTKQTVESFNGKVIVWSTTHPSYPRIQWIATGH